MEEQFIGEALCDSGADANLMSLKAAERIGNLKMYPLA